MRKLVLTNRDGTRAAFVDWEVGWPRATSCGRAVLEPGETREVDLPDGAIVVGQSLCVEVLEADDDMRF